MHPVLPTPFVEEMSFTPLYDLRTFVKNQLAEHMWINFRVFGSIDLCIAFYAVPYGFLVWLCRMLELRYRVST